MRRFTKNEEKEKFTKKKEALCSFEAEKGFHLERYYAVMLGMHLLNKL